jgi:hypothetical protein
MPIEFTLNFISLIIGGIAGSCLTVIIGGVAFGVIGYYMNKRNKSKQQPDEPESFVGVKP